MPASMTTLDQRTQCHTIDDEECPLLPKATTTTTKAEVVANTLAQQEPAGAEHSLQNIAFGGTLAAVYIGISSCMILFIKFLMHPDRFPFAACLTSLHMLTSFIMSLLLRHFAPSLFPSFAGVFGSKELPGARHNALEPFERLLPFVPIAILSAVSIVFTNGAYQHADVCFLQMVKESYVVMVYGFMVAFGLDVLKLRTVLVLAFIATSAIIAIRGAAPATFTMTGLAMQFTAGVAQSLYMVMTNKMMSHTKGLKIDPMTMVLCTAPLMLATLLPTVYVFWSPEIPGRILVWWPLLLANMLLAFVLQVTLAVTIKNISATGQALASVTKDLAIVGAARLIMGESLTLLQAGGFGGTIVGIALYSAMKVFPSWFERK